MIKNIIFDLGNVLLKFKPNKFLLRFTNDKEYIDQFVLKVTRSKTWLELDRGTNTLENARNIFLSKYPQEKDFIELFFDQWMDMLTPIKKNIEILEELKELGYSSYILSNYIKEAFSYVNSKYSFFSLFNGQIISGFENIIKPEKAIYVLLLNRYNLIPEESLFIDDILFFLKPAKKLGMKTIWNRPKTDLREELKKLDILPQTSN
ncbi:MAG TPA: HAD family phosphatase [Candidatus Nanopelagicaceae bacterium]|nr:HAD family phosphatase [Candidatus Nanopelagicaceae bacterium]